MMTKAIHDQDFSDLCWCFSAVTVIHNALMRLMMERGIPNERIAGFKTEMEKSHYETVNEIIYVVVPRGANAETQEELNRQVSKTPAAFQKLAYPSLIKVSYK